MARVARMYKGQRTALWSQFSLALTWITEVKVRFQTWGASAFAYLLSHLTVPKYIFYVPLQLNFFWLEKWVCR